MSATSSNDPATECPYCRPTPDLPQGGVDCDNCGRLLIRAAEGVDHRALLRKYILYTFGNEPNDSVSLESPSAFVRDWLEHCSDFTAKEKAELVKLAQEEIEIGRT